MHFEKQKQNLNIYEYGIELKHKKQERNGTIWSAAEILSYSKAHLYASKQKLGQLY